MAARHTANLESTPARNAIAVAVSTAVGGYAAPAAAQQQSGASAGIEEITVTARKREESLQDVSGSIQALTGADLKRQGLVNMEDVIRFLPSVNHIGGTAGANKIIFRGVSDNPGAFIAASSAALYIDEQPLTQFSINPEPRMVDIERVEALAGPQGTLYGDSSQSGTLRIITNKPDPTGFSAAADGMVRAGEDSSASHEISGVLNLPLVEDKFAIRLVGFSARDGGFIDNVLGVSPMQGTRDNSDVVGDDINSVDHIGGRVSAKWFLNDNWSVTASTIFQRSEADGRNDYDPTVGDLQTVKFFRDTRDDEWYQGALTIEGRIGNVDITSITSYFERDIDYVFDRTEYSAYFNYNFCSYYATYCWSGQTLYDQDTVGFNTLVQENDRFTQEVRLSASTDKFNWVLGAFYEEKSEDWEYRARTPEFLTSLAYNTWTYYYAASGVDPSWWLSADSTDWEQWAVFGNFTYNFTDQFSAEVGYRYFDQDVDRLYFVDKPFIVAPGVWPDATNPQGGNTDSVPKITLSYDLDDDKMIYALYSEGFRAGGANRNRTPFTQFPQAYEPDLLKNIEVGIKSLWWDNRLQFNATLYRGDWENYQIEVVDPSFNPCGPGEIPDVDLCGQPFQVMVANVGDAQQTGIEIDIKLAPSERVDMGLNLNYVEAETSEDFVVTTLVEKGTSLPNVPELKFNTFLQYTWPVSAGQGADMYFRAQYSWQDESRNQLEQFDGQTFIQDSYGIADLKLGLRTGDWVLEASLNNAFDERAELFNSPFFFDWFWGNGRVDTNRPREFGVRFAYYWE
ncbi:MAG: TonB-dependent receptor [Woeseiaceae bacterium]|nr:TonB-dependent receptor [Woeseiaceae bacterium]